MKGIVFFLLFGLAGCMMVRYTAIPKVDGNSVLLNMKYRYRIVGYKVGTNWVKFDMVKQTMEREYPAVFADDGIPFVLSESKINSEKSYLWTCFLFGFSAFTLPGIEENKEDYRYEVQVGDVSCAEYGIRYEKGSSITLFSPLGALFWHGEPDMGGYKGFYGSFFNEKVDADNKFEINRKAIAYGAAVKLRELEIAGKIDPERLKRTPSPAIQAPLQPAIVNRPKVSPPESDVNAVPEAPIPVVSKPVQVFEVDNITIQ